MPETTLTPNELGQYLHRRYLDRIDFCYRFTLREYWQILESLAHALSAIAVREGPPRLHFVPEKFLADRDLWPEEVTATTLVSIDLSRDGQLAYRFTIVSSERKLGFRDHKPILSFAITWQPKSMNTLCVLSDELRALVRSEFEAHNAGCSALCGYECELQPGQPSRIQAIHQRHREYWWNKSMSGVSLTVAVGSASWLFYIHPFSALALGVGTVLFCYLPPTLLLAYCRRRWDAATSDVMEAVSVHGLLQEPNFWRWPSHQFYHWLARKREALH